MYQDRVTQLELLQVDREKALDFYEQNATKRMEKVNASLPEKGIVEGDLVMRYESSRDFTFQTKLRGKWKGPFKVVKAFPNGTYQLESMYGQPLRYRVNGLRLKKYFSRDLVPNVNMLVLQEGTACSSEV